MDYTWKNLTSREFEIIACNFSHDMFPSYKWKLTNSTRDDNHDFYVETDFWNKWGEAKHSTKYNKTISRSQWDPTLVSAKLINSVNDILLITCAYIPLSYIIRSFHMTVNPIANIYCINRFLLNEWYSKKNQRNLLNFNTDISIISICNKIIATPANTLYNDEMKLFIFDNIEKNYLTALKKLKPHSEYTVNIALFVMEDNVEFEIKLGKYISIIDKISIKNLSYLNMRKDFSALSKDNFTCRVSKGYSVIEFRIITKDVLKENIFNQIEYKMGTLNEHFDVLMEYQKEFDEALLIKIENVIVNSNNQNKIIELNYISPDLLNRPNFKYLYIVFDERCVLNNSQLCRLFSFFVLGIDFLELDENSLKDNIYLCNYPDYFERIILGVYGDYLTIDCLKYGLNNIDTLLEQYQPKISSNTIYIIENCFQLQDEQIKILNSIKLSFSKMKNNCFMIIQHNTAKTLQASYNNDLALIGIFETGVRCQYINEENLLSYEELVIMDIDETLYFPSSKMNIMEIKTFVLNKEIEAVQEFFNKILDIVSNQFWSSRVLDFIFLIKDDLPNNIISDIIRHLRDVYYCRTDFNTAYHYSKILYRNSNSDTEQYIDDRYKEADALNHCGSIIESRKIFSEVSEKLLRKNDTKYLNKGLEALTEVYNISFWILDVGNLVQSIDKTINTYFLNGVTQLSEPRDLYPFYNCLNRKMVVQYFLEQYTEAEKTFKATINTVKLDNYIAFAYMDSARGLYNKDIHKAYERIKTAEDYLKNLFNQGKEIRRFYDCLIESAYVDFILSDTNHRSIQNLSDAVFNAKKYGYKNIVQKSYYKLAACCMVMGDITKAEYYIEKIRHNPFFSESPRNQLMYNELMKGYYHLLNNQIYQNKNTQLSFCNTCNSVEFKCFEVKKSNKFFIDTRLW